MEILCSSWHFLPFWECKCCRKSEKLLDLSSFWCISCHWISNIPYFCSRFPNFWCQFVLFNMWSKCMSSFTGTGTSCYTYTYRESLDLKSFPKERLKEETESVFSDYSWCFYSYFCKCMLNSMTSVKIVSLNCSIRVTENLKPKSKPKTKIWTSYQTSC